MTTDWEDIASYYTKLVNGIKKLIFPVSEKEPNIEIYVTADESFNIINKIHKLIEDGGGNHV